MKINGRIMYHINRNENWQVGEKKDNTCASNNHFFNVRTTKSSLIGFDGKNANVREVIDEYLEKKTFNNEDLAELAKQTRDILHNYQILSRELTLEEIRKEFYSDRVSRKNCIWLCEKKQLEYWKDILKDSINVFKVRATGKVFKSNDKLLPDLAMSYNDQVEQAHKYWAPKYTELNDEKSEFLFIGHLEVLEKVDNKIKGKKTNKKSK